MALRCLYADLDGTLLGPGASLFAAAGGRFTMLGARALEACARAGVELFLMSGRRRSQVAEPARLLGAGAYCFEVGGCCVLDGEERWLCGEFDPRAGRTPWQLIEDSGAPALLAERVPEIEPFAPWHTGREVSHLYRGNADARAVTALLEREGHGGLRLVDNGAAEGGGHAFHLVPRNASKAAAVALHMRARGYAPAECAGVGDSAEDLAVAGVVGRFYLVANAPVSDVRAQRTEGSFGEGVYEAVVRTLAESG